MAVNIKLKHSSVDGKAPVAADLENGELALNINENSPAAYIKNSNGDIVKLAGAGSVTDDDAVKKSETASQNMTGDLTLGTDKITLDATAGNIKTTGRVDVGTAAVPVATDIAISAINNSSEPTIYINNQGTGEVSIEATRGASFGGGGFVVDSSGTIQSNINSAGHIKLDSTVDFTEPNIWLNSIDGSATFASTVQVNGNPFTGIATGFAAYQDGSIALSSDSSSGTILRGYTTGNSTPTTVIKADGSATFSGNTFKIGDYTYNSSTTSGVDVDNGALTLQRPSSVDAAASRSAAGRHGADIKWEIFCDGSASFNGSITNSGLTVYNTPTLGGGGQIGWDDTTKSLKLYSNSSTNSNATAEFYFNQGSTPDITFSQGGSASFAERIQSGGLPYDGEKGVATSASGTVYVSSIASSPIWQGYTESSTTPTSSISSDGSVSFASGLATIDRFGQLNVNTPTSTGYAFQSRIQGGSETCIIQGDGSASFKGTVDTDAFFWSKNTDSENAGCFIYNFDNNILRNNEALIVSPTESSSNSTITLNYDGSAEFSGTVTAAVVPPSDARFKENITPAKPQLADVVALGGLLKNYDWNDQAPLNEEIRSQRQLGLIAQEAAEVCPSIVKDIHRTKQGAVITPEEIIPAVYEDKVIPAEYETVVTPAKLGPKGRVIVPESTEEVLVTPESTEQVLVTPENVIPATYEKLDDSYKGISSEALIMKLIGAVTELSAEVAALKAAKLTKK